ncbi:anti-sigma factor family protein [Saccharibacillus alkalitolerans]|uniref:Zinc-finger domain-containing protein n=1 Tax=Saccharibacillus alkalitolerans TaxID=2705290 RepID=A0ABX0F180_9BACL|nr:hypothetical protein [Saccharibacillus alkalitolerans]NGZ73809.1 hypothetical protein [Saccharibacillus alkalitolerans]
MRREEALEYMNRYLDHDLSEQETEELFRHLGDSPEAREDFEFLKGLSDKLESLPDVQPPISLVDSILPRLNEINRAANAAEPKAAPEMLSEMESKRMFGEEAPNRRRPASFWRSALGRTVGGTAVAAAVLGIFVATYEPKEMPNAEMTTGAAVTSTTDDTLVPSAGSETESDAAADGTDPSTEAKAIQPNVNTESGSRQAEPDSEPAQGGTQTRPGTEADSPDTAEPTPAPPEESSVPQPSGKSESGRSDASGSKSEGPSSKETPRDSADPNRSQESEGGTQDGTARNTQTQKEKTETKPEAKPEAKSEAKTEKKPDSSANAKPKGTEKKDAATDPAPESASPPSASDEEALPNESMGIFSEEDPAQKSEESAGQGEGSSESAENREADSRIYGLTVAPSEWKSPNGTYRVTYSRNVLKLLNGSGTKELGNRKVDGDVIGGVWSADGKTFTYDLAKPDGTTGQGTWKVEETTLEQGGK